MNREAPGTIAASLLLVSMSVTTPIVELAVGDQLPTLKGEFLTGRPAVLPEAASGRAALLMLGFSYDSRFAVETWATRFRQDFGARTGVTFFEIPMIGGFATMGKWFIDRGMRGGTPEADRENVITVYGGIAPWKRRLGFQDPSAAYLMLIDPGGTIVWRYAGGFDEGRYNSLSSELSKLLAGKL